MRIEFDTTLAQGFDHIVTRELRIAADSEQSITLPLTHVQLTAVLAVLGARFDETGCELYGDEQLTREILPMLGTLSPEWVQVPRAAELLGVTTGRVYAIIKAEGLDVRQIDGKTYVSAESIEARLNDKPKAGRRW